MSKLEPVGEGWRLPCEGLRVSQIRIDYSFGLELTEDQERAIDEPWRIRINTQLRYSKPGLPETMIDPQAPAPSVAPALSVRHQTLTRGQIERDGRLILEFAEGDRFDVHTHDRYEAWEATGGGGDTRVFLVSPIAPDTYE